MAKGEGASGPGRLNALILPLFIARSLQFSLSWEYSPTCFARSRLGNIRWIDDGSHVISLVLVVSRYYTHTKCGLHIISSVCNYLWSCQMSIQHYTRNISIMITTEGFVRFTLWSGSISDTHALITSIDLIWVQFLRFTSTQYSIGEADLWYPRFWISSLAVCWISLMLACPIFSKGIKRLINREGISLLSSNSSKNRIMSASTETVVCTHFRRITPFTPVSSGVKRPVTLFLAFDRSSWTSASSVACTEDKGDAVEVHSVLSLDPKYLSAASLRRFSASRIVCFSLDRSHVSKTPCDPFAADALAL